MEGNSYCLTDHWLLGVSQIIQKLELTHLETLEEETRHVSYDILLCIL